MTKSAWLVVPGGASIIILSGALGAPQAPSAPQVFRERVDVVSVDTSVTDRNRPVAGLKAKDFSLTDNGVPQHIESVSSEGVPIDVSVVLDLSTEQLRHRRLEELRSDARRIAAFIGPEDRIGVLADATYVTEVSTMQPASSLPLLDSVSGGGGTSTLDAVVMALLRPTEPGRRHLVVVFTEGIDYLSVIDFETVAAIAKRADALLYVVMAKTWTGGYGRGQLALPRSTQFFAQTADATGGGARTLSRGVVEALRDIVDDFHHSYVLRYIPRGIERPGWHQLAVTLNIPGAPSYLVRARKGYYAAQ